MEHDQDPSYFNKIEYIYGLLFIENRVLYTRLQTQRLNQRRTFAFSAYGRKFKPPAIRVVVG